MWFLVGSVRAALDANLYIVGIFYSYNLQDQHSNISNYQLNPDQANDVNLWDLWILYHQYIHKVCEVFHQVIMSSSEKQIRNKHCRNIKTNCLTFHF